MTFTNPEKFSEEHLSLDAAVYFVVSPGEGSSYRIYGDEQLLADGGIHMIEQSLERESYWYARLGTIPGEPSSFGLTFPESSFSRLPKPNEMVWKIGRENPGYRVSDAERAIFKSTFLAIEQLLETWRHEADGVVEAYTLGVLHIGPERLVGMAGALQHMARIHEVVGVSVIKYWYDPAWPEPHCTEMVLSEFALRIPLQLRRSLDPRVAIVEVMPFAYC